MTITEKTAYLKGLLEGMKISKEDDVGKLLTAIIDTLDDMALSISDLEQESDIVSEELDLIEDAIDELDEDLEEIFELIDQSVCDCEHEDELEDDDELDEGEYYELSCPTCEEKIVIDEDMLDRGSMKCPACGEDLEFDFSELEDDGEQ